MFSSSAMIYLSKIFETKGSFDKNMKRLFPLLILMLAFSAQAFAVDFTVNLTTDQHDANLADSICDADLATPGEQCTLRAAVEQANKLISDDRVLFNLPPDSVITLTEANGGQILISNSDARQFNQLQIIGTGANNLTIDGGDGAFRIFSVNNYDSNLTKISDLALTGGNGSLGGAISSLAGQLLLDRVYIYDNTAEQGGGVFSGGGLTISNSTISGNTATGAGGGIVSGNNGCTIVNSTISGNSAVGNAGGILVNGSASLINVTITSNTATNGGGIAYQSNKELRLRNTIVARNTTTNGIGPEIYNDGTSSLGIVSEGFNLIGDQSGDSTFTGKPVSYSPTDILDTDPLLDLLGNNGGPTLTHALLFGSPAINAGNNDGAPVADQRGYPRIASGTIDIGAYEYQQNRRKRVRIIF
jgi:hypothetical protein